MVPALSWALVPADCLPPGLMAPAIWDVEYLYLLLGSKPGSSCLGPPIQRPLCPPANPSEHRMQSMGVLPMGNALPTGLQNLGKYTVGQEI